LKREFREESERNSATIAEKLARVNELEERERVSKEELSAIENSKEELGKLRVLLT